MVRLRIVHKIYKVTHTLETSDVARPVPLGRDRSGYVGLRQITKLVAI